MEVTQRERDLMKAVPEMDGINSMVGTVKLQASGGLGVGLRGLRGLVFAAQTDITEPCGHGLAFSALGFFPGVPAKRWPLPDTWGGAVGTSSGWQSGWGFGWLMGSFQATVPALGMAWQQCARVVPVRRTTARLHAMPRAASLYSMQVAGLQKMKQGQKKARKKAAAGQ